MALQFINPALQGAKGISNLKTLLFGGGPVGAVMLGASQAPRFVEAGRQNPTGSSQMSILGSMGSNLAGDKATRGKPRKTEGYSSYGTYTVGGIEYDINSGRPTYMPAGSVYPSSSVAPFVPAQRQAPGRGPGPGLAAPPIPQISPEERAYNEERSRIEQLTAQNPEFQNVGQLRNDLRDQGMAIWQQKYGNTPMGQPGGAIGTFNPLMQRTFGYQTGSAPDQQMGAPTQGPTPNIPQVDQSLNPASPTFIGGEGAPLMDFTKENLTPEMIELYQKQLMEQARRK